MSLLKTGLLQLSPESVVLGDITYYDRGPAVVDRVDRESIAEVLGSTSKVNLLLHVIGLHRIHEVQLFVIVYPAATVHQMTP